MEQCGCVKRDRGETVERQGRDSGETMERQWREWRETGD